MQPIQSMPIDPLAILSGMVRSIVAIAAVILIGLTERAGAEEFSFRPETVYQGDALQLHGESGAAKARLNRITISLFKEANGSAFGLMPIGVEAEPGEYKLEFLDTAGSVIHTLTVDVKDAHFPKQDIVISQALSQLRATTEEARTVRAFLAIASPTRYWTTLFQPPVPGCVNSPFGASRLHNGKPTGDYHGGVDQRGAKGSPIHAATGGTVRIVRMFRLRGGTVAIDHGQGLETIYMHMSRFAVRQGQRVRAGAIIGYVGSTGRATGPHLHWSLYANGRPVNPNRWVKLTSCDAPPDQP